MGKAWIGGTSLTACVIALAACGSGSGGASDASSPSGAPPFNGAGGSGMSFGNGAAGGSTLPPEKEIESSFVSPVATGHFVWVANPTSGRVAYIDAVTLEIRLVDAGHAPTWLAALPGGADSAIVLNVLSLDATVLRATPSGSLTTASLPVPSGGNAWAISPDGRFALAWSDARKVTSPDPVDGFQDISVLDLTPGAETSTPITVGYRPVSVAFDAASARAFVVTQDGVAIVNLSSGPPAVVGNVTITSVPTEAKDVRDVAVTPDGSYALVRRENAMTLAVVSLADGSVAQVDLPAPATGMRLSAKGDIAVTVIRDTGEVLLLPVPGIFQSPTAFTTVAVGTKDNVVGSVVLAPSSPMAFLYSSALPNPLLTLLDTSAPKTPPRVVLVRAQVDGVFPTSDAANAIVLHDGPPLDANGKPSSMYKAAFSVVPVAAELPPKIQGLAALPVSVAIAPGGDKALVASGPDDKGPWAVHVISMPSQKIDAYALASPPTATGIVPEAGRGYVAQKHPDGRITFLDFATGEARTLTGFELASQVVYGKN